MRHDQQRALVLRQLLRQELARRRVEVVRRLVQQHVLRPPHEDLRQRDAHLPAAAEVAARLVAVAPARSQVRRARGRCARRCGSRRAARTARTAPPARRSARRCRRRRARCVRNLVQRLVDGARLRKRRPHLLHEAALGVVSRLLPQEAEAAAPVSAPRPRPACRRPRCSRRIVDLPAPFGPTSPARSPSLTVKLTSCRTSTLPKDLATCSAYNIPDMVSGARPRRRSCRSSALAALRQAHCHVSDRPQHLPRQERFEG